MPPRFVYWTIVAGGLPTAFRAAEREELLPTFKRIQEKHPDAKMKYFARGRLWTSQEEARHEAEARRTTDRRPESRGRDWRPGGEHRDPRQTFKDAKKDRNLRWRKERFERGQRAGTAPRPEPAGAAPRPAQRPPGASKPQGEWRDRPSRPPAKNRFDRNQGAGERRGPPKPKWSERPPKPGEGPKPAPRPPKPAFRPAKPPFRPSGPPERGRRSGGPPKGPRRRS